jgi:hypothetical protein
MSHKKYNLVEILANCVIDIIKSIDRAEKDTYPVLGAEGNKFFIEIATGIFGDRQILKTIYVEICRDSSGVMLEDALISDNDISIGLPDESLLIALLGLFENAMNAKTMILHPLDDKGNFLPGWNQAVVTVSSNTLS